MGANKISDFIEKAAQETLEREAKQRGITPEELDREQKAEQAKRAAAYEEQRSKEIEEQNRIFKEKTEVLGEKLGLGIPVVPAEIIMLRQLTERSMGTGVDNRSVVHLRVLEDFSRGRLRRKKGQLLCGRKGKFDIHNVEPVETTHSCSRCVEIVSKGKPQ